MCFLLVAVVMNSIAATKWECKRVVIHQSTNPLGLFADFTSESKTRNRKAERNPKAEIRNRSALQVWLLGSRISALDFRVSLLLLRLDQPPLSVSIVSCVPCFFTLRDNPSAPPSFLDRNRVR